MIRITPASSMAASSNGPGMARHTANAVHIHRGITARMTRMMRREVMNTRHAAFAAGLRAVRLRGVAAGLTY